MRKKINDRLLTCIVVFNLLSFIYSQTNVGIHDEYFTTSGKNFGLHNEYFTTSGENIGIHDRYLNTRKKIYLTRD